MLHPSQHTPTDTSNTVSVATQLIELVMACFVGMLLGMLVASVLGLPASMETPHLYYCIVSVCSMGLPAGYILLRQRRWQQAVSCPAWQHVVFALLSFVLSYPMAAFLTQWNEGVRWPSFLESYEASSRVAFDASQQQLHTLLMGGNSTDLLINLLVFALVPAVCEELLFRGVLQQLFQQQFRHHHLAVWLAALVFSLIHLQMLAFFPRWWLGVVIGYAYYHTKTLWAPIVVHLLNNATVVVMLHYWGGSAWYERFMHTPISWGFGALALVSVLLVTALIRGYQKRNKAISFSSIDYNKTT